MTAIITLFAFAFSFIVFLPFVYIPLVYILVKQYHRNQDSKKILRTTADITVLLFVVSVIFLINDYFQSEIGYWLILLWVLLLGGLLSSLQYQKYGQLHWKKLLLGTGRLSLLIFVILYVVFFVLGIFQRFHNS